MPKPVDEAEAKRIAIEHVKKQESGAQPEIKSAERQEIWLMEISWPVQTENMKGTQYARVTVSGSGEVKEYEKTRFRGASVAQKVLSKLRDAFSRGKPTEKG